MKTPIKSWPWAERIIEISLKTLLELNTEFSILSVPHSEKIKGNQIKPMGDDGFELIDERQVCTKIIQNSMNSFLFSGSWQQRMEPHIKEGFRFWHFYRETPYQSKSTIFCDIILDRVEYDGKEITPTKQPVYIEAKRAKTKTINDLNDGKSRVTRKSNYLNSYSDITRMIDERKYVIAEKIYKNIFCHLLIWGETINSEKDNPTACCKFLNNKLMESEKYKANRLEIHQIRWFPLDRIDSEKLKSNYKVKKWGWVALMHII